MRKEKYKRSFWRRSIWVVASVVIVAGVTFGVRQIAASSPQGVSNVRNSRRGPVPVTAGIATLENVPEIINAVGTVQSIDSVAIQPRVTGAIEKIEFEPGQDVKSGQELFLIDPRPYQAALDQAKAQLAHDKGVLAEAEMDLTRYQTLEKQKSIAAQTAQDQIYVVQQDKGTVDLDQANVETARLNLDYCHINAPISGRAGVLLVDLGNVVGPVSGPTNSTSTTQASSGSGSTISASTLVSISQLQPIYVSFNVPQTALEEIIHNQAHGPLEVEAYSQAGEPLGTGTLSVINNEVTTSTGTVTLQATFANRHNALWPGEYVSTRLIAGMRRDVVTVPASAVMFGPNGDYAYVIDARNKVHRVNVQQRARRGGITVISKGISAGQKVVTAGQYRLNSGAKVAIKQTKVPRQAARAGSETAATN